MNTFWIDLHGWVVFDVYHCLRTTDLQTFTKELCQIRTKADKGMVDVKLHIIADVLYIKR